MLCAAGSAGHRLCDGEEGAGAQTRHHPAESETQLLTSHTFAVMRNTLQTSFSSAFIHLEICLMLFFIDTAYLRVDVTVMYCLLFKRRLDKFPKRLTTKSFS